MSESPDNNPAWVRLTCLTVAFSIAAVTAAATYGCSISYTSYSAAMIECAKSGGSFVPTGNRGGSSEYLCLHLGGRQ
jgi:hypothetical protein